MLEAVLGPDILTYLGGGAFQAIIGFIKQRSAQDHELKMTYTKEYVEYLKSVDKVTVYQWTKAIIIFMVFIGYFYALPFFANFYHIPQYVSFSDSNGFFVSLFNGDSDIHWHVVNSGIVYSPIMDFVLGQLTTSFFMGAKYGS